VRDDGRADFEVVCGVCRELLFSSLHKQVRLLCNPWVVDGHVVADKVEHEAHPPQVEPDRGGVSIRMQVAGSPARAWPEILTRNCPGGPLLYSMIAVGIFILVVAVATVVTVEMENSSGTPLRTPLRSSGLDSSLKSHLLMFVLALGFSHLSRRRLSAASPPMSELTV